MAFIVVVLEASLGEVAFVSNTSLYVLVSDRLV